MLEIRVLADGNEEIDFEGTTYKRYINAVKNSMRNYFSPIRGSTRKGKGYLHREIWKSQRGDIPEGMVGHHKDGNTLNNSIDNFEIMRRQDHQSMHAKAHFIAHPEFITLSLQRARDAASEWHGSPEGIEWHKQQFKKHPPVKKRAEMPCKWCGIIFVGIIGESEYCTAACYQRMRHFTGKNNVEKICAGCGKIFISDICYKKKTCSRKCTSDARKEKMRLQHNS